MLRALDLFSGIGGISVALGDYARTIGYVEIDKYAQSVLLSRMFSRDIETAPIFRDITRLDGTKLRGSIDLICGGFPCQDLSVAGKGKGLAGERSGLFFEIIRLVKEISPRFVFLENVPAIRTRGLSEVVNAFTEIGYDCRWTCLSAASVGAPHKRERWFLLGYSKHNGQLAAEIARSDAENDKKESTREIGSGESERASQNRDVSRDFSNLADSMCEGLERQWEESFGAKQEQQNTLHDGWWSIEPSVGRVVDGLPPELDFFIFESEEHNESDIESCDQETIAEINLFNRQVLRKMWENREIAASSPELYFRRLHDSLPSLPQRPTHFRENLGSRIAHGSELHDLWSSFYASTEQVEQAVWQSELLKRIWEIKCEETMAKSNRVDRIKCLGNSVVPLQVKTAFERLIGYASI